MDWKIKNYKSMSKNTLIGKFDLEVSPMIVKGWTHHKKNDSEWVNAPSVSFTDDDGETKYSPIVWFPDKTRYAKFQQWCLDEVGKLQPATDPAEGNDSLPF
jgi:hypothetical protein